MLEAIESLSWISGTFLVSAISVVIALFTGRLRFTGLRWAAVVGAPVIVSYSLYWSPVWLGANPSEYSAWSLAFILPWSLVGVLVSVAVLIAVRQYIKEKHGRNA